MKKYLISEIVKRAKDFADISNSDIISWNEAIDYVNDAWKQCLQLMINKHDLFFVKEVTLKMNGVGNPTVFDLPNDVYEIEAIYNKNTGDVLTRRTTSGAGDYEIYNNKLRVWGVYNNLTLRYWVTPLYLTFPNKTFTIEKAENIIDTCNNYALFSDGEIIDLLTNEVVGNVDEVPENATYVLGRGHLLMFGEYENEGETLYALTYASYDGGVLYEGNVKVEGYYKDENGNVYYSVKNDDDKYDVYKLNKKVYENLESPSGTFIGDKIIDGHVTVVDYDEKGYLKLEDDKVTFNYLDGFNFEVENPDLKVVALCRYGIITTNGTTRVLRSWYPDIEMNLPNDVFFSVLCAQLALYFCNKQNADNAGVSLMLQNYTLQYKNSLGNDAAYDRIIDVY